MHIWWITFHSYPQFRTGRPISEILSTIWHGLCTSCQHFIHRNQGSYPQVIHYFMRIVRMIAPQNTMRPSGAAGAGAAGAGRSPSGSAIGRGRRGQRKRGRAGWTTPLRRGAGHAGHDNTTLWASGRPGKCGTAAGMPRRGQLSAVAHTGLDAASIAFVYYWSPPAFLGRHGRRPI